MKVDKMSISFEASLGDQVRDAAQREGKGLSSWLAEAAAARLRAAALTTYFAEWERENDPITDEELAHAREDLGIASRSPVA